MLKHFRSSPLWLIGLFIIFAQATAGIAAVRIEGWPQAALVLFVIGYSTVVTAIFFLFLWFRPQNFYGPVEYEGISPEDYSNALAGLPKSTADAVEEYRKNPEDEELFYELLDNLLPEDTKQHLILIKKKDGVLDVSDMNEMGFSHAYEIVTRNKGVYFGQFSPIKFTSQLAGTRLIRLSGGNDKLFLTKRGEQFTDWVIKHERDAETFNSDVGRWGKEQSAADVVKERSEARKRSKEPNPVAGKPGAD